LQQIDSSKNIFNLIILMTFNFALQAEQRF